MKPAASTTGLNAAQWQRVSGLFDAARELPPADRPALLAQLQAQDPALAAWLRDMLAAHASARSDDWLERGPQLSAGDIDDAIEDGPHAGVQLGPWRLHERLGSGGMASVWRATRVDALPAREVALKLPLGLAHTVGGARLAERFAREQAILARLEHPYIARLYETGVAVDGTPWLAMECVHGLPIDTWCDQRRLDVPGRLRLYLQVLDAVQYAHARLVIHRDLKPSNIFVTEDGQVRLLDFGIARLLAADEMPTAGQEAPALTQAHQRTLTQAHQRAMTPAYAAPEQLHGQALTTAVDIYALGVVLYRLLVGRSPYRLKIETPAQLEQAIASADVQRASSAVAADSADAAALRSTRPSGLRRALAGDLDTLLEKAMAHDPARRYASAAAMADDITRHLQGRPLTARPDAALYRLRKYLARHRLQAAALAAVLLSLTVGLGAATWQAGEARRERNVARAEADRGNAINFFFADLLEEAARSDQPINGSALVARAETLARREFKDQPDALATVLLAMGTVHNSAGRLPEARRVLEEALALARDATLHDDVACDLALLLEDRRRALAMLNAVADRRDANARSRAACLVYLGDLQRAADAPRAEQRYRQALAEWERSSTRSPHDHATIVGRLAYVQALQGHTAQALAGYQQALGIANRVGRDASTMGQALHNRLGRTLLMAGVPQQALAVFDQILQDRQRSQRGGAMPSDVLINRTQALLDLGRAADAVPAAQQALDAAGATQHDIRAAQARCLLQWAQALATPAVMERPGDTDSPDALVRATCTLARAQQLRAGQRWPELLALLNAAMARGWPEPQWAVDARLLRAQAHGQLGQRAQAADDARAARDEARRLHDGTHGTAPRVTAAEHMLARYTPR